MSFLHKLARNVKAFLLLACAASLAACGGSSSDDNDNDLSDIRVYKPLASYASVLSNCAQAQTRAQACTLTTLPLLGMEKDTLSKQDILDRVLVSHSWMGQRFEELLDKLPPEMLPLFKSVTAIVIDDDIRPAYYTSLTAAIYLDPNFFWLNESEKNTINKKEDFRAGFANELLLRALARYVKDGALAYDFGSLNNAESRTLDDVVLILANLLLHELAHANDILPVTQHATIDRSMKPLDAAASVLATSISFRLTNTDPLTSDILFKLGDVMYNGTSAENETKSVTAQQAGQAFEPDQASDHYGYSSRFEDTAMLFEEAMMKRFFDIDRDVAFVSATPGVTVDCSNSIIGWGVRLRIGDSDVKSRAQFVVNELLPTLSTDLFFQDLPAPSSLSVGEKWCESIALPNETAAPGQQGKPKHIHALSQEQWLRPYQ